MAILEGLNKAWEADERAGRGGRTNVLVGLVVLPLATHTEHSPLSYYRHLQGGGEARVGTIH